MAGGLLERPDGALRSVHHHRQGSSCRLRALQAARSSFGQRLLRRLLLPQQCRHRRRAGATVRRPGGGSRRRLSPRQWHAGHLLRQRRGAVRIDPCRPGNRLSVLFAACRAAERGGGGGRDKPLTLPLPRGTQAPEYLAALDQGLDTIRDHRADLIVLSFGADTFENDPISHFQIRREDYPAIAGRIAALELPVLVVMEGGYAVDDLGHNVAAFLSGFA